jgi:hypothetical protein
MTCQRFHNWIKDAAVDSLDPGRKAKLTAHLTNCASCQEFFGEEQWLIGAIDRGLRERLNREPAPDVVARVRIRLAEEGDQSRSRVRWGFGAWVPAYAVGVPVLVLLIIAIWSLNRPATPWQVAFVTTPTAHVHGTTSEEQTKETFIRLSGPIRGRGSRRLSAATQGNEFEKTAGERLSPDMQVLVQPGQWAAIAQLSQTMRAGGTFRSSPLGEIAEQEQPIELGPFAIKAIEIRPIAIKPVAITPPAIKPIEIEPVEVSNIGIAEVF